ncbi:MAG: hypothetical protein JEZ03_15540 [Bacteroidales bacterium]|nr:hypothetical protein [Bacteroidales bacterium]
MSKVYFYEEDVQLADNQEVIVRVELPGAGTICQTIVTIQGDGLIKIKDEGLAIIGDSTKLKNKMLYITSNPSNLAAEVTKIRENIFVNDKLIIQHQNDKAEEKDPQLDIEITIKASTS